MRQLLIPKKSIFMDYCVPLRPVIGSNYAEERNRCVGVFLAGIAVRNELSEFDNMEAVQFRERKQACQNPAVCLIELFVTFENQQGGLSKDILRRYYPRKKTMPSVLFSTCS